MPVYLQYALCGIVLLLLVGTIVIGLKAALKPSTGDRELWLRMYSWWIMAGLFVVVIALGRVASIVFFCLISLLALKEYFSIVHTRQSDKHLLKLLFITVPIQYLWVWQACEGLFFTFIPVIMFLIVLLSMIVKGETQGFLKTAGILHWGLMTSVFLLSHAAYLLALPSEKTPLIDGASLLVFLVLLTQVNDVLQFVWGKLLGTTKIVPKISPSKTWAGLIGGVLSTTGLAWLIAPYLTSFTAWQPFVAGAIIGLGGFIGDVIMSAIKRDLGIKDTGNLIPGHGGILDRIDSLIVTAPLFFYFIYYVYY